MCSFDSIMVAIEPIMNMKHVVYWIFLYVLLVAALPIMGAAAILVALIDGFPVFYRQRRVGLGGRPFTMYKFRTMVIGADALQKKYSRLNEADGPVFKIRNDPRLTKFGRFLSHTGLDELPQLCNVLQGDMALIGPRPLPVDEAKKLAPWMEKRHEVNPGIISPWILEGHNHGDFAAWMKSDIAYASRKSLGHDSILAVCSVIFLLHLLTRELTSLGSGKR
jgi:lipopolysaccharide/colanic/teichoic acid biosynthesis glycosyltransferase